MKKVTKVGEDYLAWIAELKKRYKATQIKAAVAVNSAMIEFYWNLGKDISEKYPGKRRNVEFFATLSRDLQRELGGGNGLSERNIHYALSFYDLYVPYLPQVVADKTGSCYLPQVVADKTYHRQQLADGSANAAYRPQVVDDKNLPQVVADLVSVPWGHHMLITDYELKRILPPEEKLQEAMKECGVQSAACGVAAPADTKNAKVAKGRKGF